MNFRRASGMLLTGRSGRLRIVNAEGQLSAPLGGVPEVYARGQGGLREVRHLPDFEQDRLVYPQLGRGGDDGKAGTTL